MMNARLLVAALALAATTAGFGVARAATPRTAQAPATTATHFAHGPQAKHASKHAARRARQRPAHALHTTAIDRMHQRVVLARSAQQRRLISDGLRHGRLNATQAGPLRSWVAQVADHQASLSRRGHESVEQALAISHEQDLLDWSIRTGHTEFEPRYQTS